jgi:hypothetical protein
VTAEAQQQHMQQLMALAGLSNQESQRLLTLENVPFMQDPTTEKSLRERVKGWIVLNELRNERGVQAAIEKVLQKRNNEVLETTG